MFNATFMHARETGGKWNGTLVPCRMEVYTAVIWKQWGRRVKLLAFLIQNRPSQTEYCYAMKYMLVA